MTTDPLARLRRARPEGEIQRAILQYLGARGIFAWRANTGAIAGESNGRRRFVRFGVKGQADILGMIPPAGKFIAVEVKRPGEHPTPHQLAFLDCVRRHGGLAFVASSVEDVAREFQA